MSKSFAVLGSPIAHSKSPLIHAAAYRVLNEDWSYDRFEVQKGALKRFIENEGNSYSGFSLTMPLKENAFSFADELDSLSTETGAVNTLAKFGDKWFGFNTDVYGIIQAIREKTLANFEKVTLIGSGATAKSAMVAISQLSPGAEVVLVARNSKTAKQLALFGKQIGLRVRKGRFLVWNLIRSDLVISTLPGRALDAIAQKLVARSSFKPKGLLLDVAYDPWPSKIAELWSNRGATVTSGKEMLIWQAVAQVRIFKNGNPGTALMNEVAVLEAMRIAVDES